MTAELPVDFDDNGLVPVVTTDATSGEVLMLAFMNADALARTRETGLVHYWSRSRRRLWLKGQTSGHVQKVQKIYINCDLNSLMIEVEQVGAVCHDGYPTCYYRRLEPDNSLTTVRDRWFDPADVYGERDGIAMLTRLWWDAYSELASPAHTTHSGTSRLLLSEQDQVTPRIVDELRELAGALDGSHRHLDLRADVLLEGGQVCYWTVLRCIRAGLSWDVIRPDRALTPIEAEDVAPIATTAALIRQLADRWDIGSDSVGELAGRAHETMTFVARACALAGVEPITAIRNDLDELRTRPYLAAFFTGKDSLASA